MRTTFVLAKQFTNDLGRDPEIREFIGGVLSSSNIDPNGMKFSLTAKNIEPALDGNKLRISLSIGVYSFCRTLVALAQKYEAARGRTAIAERTLEVQNEEYLELTMEEVYTHLTEIEQTAWDAERDAMNKAAAKAELKAEAEVIGRPLRVIREIRGLAENIKKDLAEIQERFQQNISYHFSWRVRDLGTLGHKRDLWASILNVVDNSEQMGGGPEEQLDFLYKVLSSFRRQSIREVMRRRTWLDGGRPENTIDRLCQAEAHADFAEFCEQQMSTIDWMTGRERCEAFC